MEENVFENDYFTLTDENGNEIEFELIGQCEKDGQQYLAMIPVEDEKDAQNKDVYEYVILKVAIEDGEEVLIPIEDDDEYDFVADAFIERLQDLFEINEE